MNNWEDLEHRLPKTPRPGMLIAALGANEHDELGGELLIYARESFCLDDITGWPDVDGQSGKSRWGARCTCTACGEDFCAGWLKGGGIAMIVGDDGSAYTGVPEKDGQDYVVGWTDGDICPCPLCGETLTVTHRNNLRNGRTYQLMVGSVERVDNLAVVMTWIVSRQIDADGVWTEGVRPFGAAVLMPDGALRRYAHETVNGFGGAHSLPKWTAVRSWRDPFQLKYYSWEAMCQKKLGAWVWGNIPDLAGTTAEKTGIAEYIRAGGRWPNVYLETWRKHRNVENLLKCGMALAVAGRIDAAIDSAIDCGLCKRNAARALSAVADMDFAKPRQMLHFTRAEVASCGTWRWSAGKAELWMQGVRAGVWAAGDAEMFERMVNLYGLENVRRYVSECADGLDFESVQKWDAYLQKQHSKHGMPFRTGFELLLDYRAELAAQIDVPDAAELWPRDLRAAHDRIFAAKKQREDTESVANFLAVAETWSALEWSDGEICIRLPRCNNDLIAEGHTLHHCVGGYGTSHLSGKLILFVRHARRPERSWYTLNINVTGDRPTRIQLHGYGNEWAHGGFLHIPQRVLDFVDRWETEILAPAFRAVRASQANAKVSRKRRKGAA